MLVDSRDACDRKSKKPVWSMPENVYVAACAAYAGEFTVAANDQLVTVDAATGNELGNSPVES